ncbi:uncharacterized protein F4822DRAFT_430857 [Hypoxylon trugodes]|uniref:uncharacterized protein n=1 Tax=Hypoxylon trugodes TaxID=326681 RepID=UPI00219D2625|nr:uncharacterized protein F4822DRAFT_430857 [Hypoxylon trugodes]KAI1388102.1 hypothetical protein F4822DRAFT_430857 [Hypoxylon trugodes]
MSFGWSTGDIIAAAKLVLDLSRALDDVSGAPEHYRRSAATLRSIRFRLSILSKVTGVGRNDDSQARIYELAVLGKDEYDDMNLVVVNLKSAFGRLKILVAKGCDMKFDLGSGKRRREWPAHQINKSRWYIGKEDEVNRLVQHIFELTASLPDFYQKLNSELLKQQNTTQAVYHQTQITWLKAIFERLEGLDRAVSRDQSYQGPGEGRLPLLHAGPDLGVPPIPSNTGFDTKSTIDHLESVAHTIMTTNLSSRVKDIQVDHYLKRKLEEWFSGQTHDNKRTPPRLWLYGDKANIVSATIYTAALDRRLPILAFAGRHVAEGKYLAPEDRFYRMVYSLLFQLLQQFEDVPAIAITGIDRPFTELDLTMDSTPLALKYMAYFLSLIPECTCIVDGWNFISVDADATVKNILKMFLDMFEEPPGLADEIDSRPRLLITSPGNSQMLRDVMGEKQGYVDGFNLRSHVGVNGSRLHTLLLGMEW